MTSRLLAIALSALLFVAGMASANPFSPKGQTFRLTVDRIEGGDLRLRWAIPDGDYLYRDKLSVTTPDGRTLPLSTAAGESKDDPNFGPTEVYHQSAEAIVAASDVGDPGDLRITYQGCAEKGICYPPVTQRLDLATLSLAVDRPALPGEPASPKPVPTNSGADGSPGLPSLTGSWLLLAATFVGFGLLLAFTPCVLPMVPILAGMLSRADAEAATLRGFGLSTAYVLAMACAYASLGIAAAWSGQNLQVALQMPAALVAMAAVFVALALSSFGLFELRLPGRMVAALSGAPTSRLGPFLAAAALGFTSALIVGPCVTPPLAAALIYVAQTGDGWRGAFALFFLGLGMGLPLIAVGTFGARILPRSGPWLLVVNKVFGVVFLIVATMLVGRVLPPPAGLALWAALAVGIGVFAGAFDPLVRAAGPWSRLRKAFGVLAVAYGLTLVVGAAAGSGDPLRPLVFGAPVPGLAEESAAKTVRNAADLDAALTRARAAERPIMIAFSAEWCSSCKTIEREVFAAPSIRERLRNVTVIRADVTGTGAESTALMSRFGIVGPPTVFFLDPRSGSEIAASRSVGDISVGSFGRLLDLAGA